ncbi:MAG: hypothetical protein A2157_15870 [Deltaproteobacteria bacterium RBG_16_47_11]|nr:MAG: hypothetical protein A2157_15870 [Deltaproteobacteria bacterium RBG_16_47_11]
MKKGTHFFLALLIVVLWLEAPVESLAGMVVEQVLRDREGNPSKVLLYFSDGLFRTDHPASGLTTIMGFREDRLVMIDHRSRNYIEIKLSQWEREVARRLKEEIPGIMLKERKIIVKRTGRSTVINGFQTEQIEVWAEGELIEENWMTRDVKLTEIEKVMDRVAQGFSEDFRLEMKEGREIYEKLKPYGFPILIKDYTTTYGLGAVDRLEVKKIEKKELEKEVFLPPAGYQRIVPKYPHK